MGSTSYERSSSVMTNFILYVKAFWADLKALLQHYCVALMITLAIAAACILPLWILISVVDLIVNPHVL